MTKNSTYSINSTWTGMVPVEDTALAVTDTDGPGVPVVYLNGQFGTHGYWWRVIAELGPGWRHITYDERARGRSRTSSDYSFAAAVRDVDAVLAARDVDRALLVGWSYGAFVAPLLRPTGLTPRMTAGQQAESNIELGVLARERELGPMLDAITVPVRYLLASGTSFGSKGDEQERTRAAVQQVVARNPNIRISAKVPSNHGAILKKDFRVVADAVREIR